MSFVKLEKDASRISVVCDKGRALRARLQHDDASLEELLDIVREVRSLDSEMVTWREGPEWSYAALNTSDLVGDPAVLSTFPALVHIHPDIWAAYEWNYHNTSRILMHKQLLSCLNREVTASVQDGDHDTTLTTLLDSLKAESVTIIQGITTKILATVPQMMGDLDYTGQVRQADGLVPRCRAIGAYFLLWPIKILKGDGLAGIIEDGQIAFAAATFDRIREYTGMKDLLGDESII